MFDDSWNLGSVRIFECSYAFNLSIRRGSNIALLLSALRTKCPLLVFCLLESFICVIPTAFPVYIILEPPNFMNAGFGFLSNILTLYIGLISLWNG